MRKQPLYAYVSRGQIEVCAGPLHGTVYVEIGALLEEAKHMGAARAARQRIARNTPVPKFGHPLYPQGDPRAVTLFTALDVPEDVSAFIDCVALLTVLKSTIDVASAALVERCALPDGAAFALFAIGRSIGWMAYSIEQCLSGSLLRLRARYVGTSIDGAVG